MYDNDENEYGYERYTCGHCHTSFYSDTTPGECENCGYGRKDEDEEDGEEN